jgi:hypothetical protein
MDRLLSPAEPRNLVARLAVRPGGATVRFPAQFDRADATSRLRAFRLVHVSGRACRQLPARANVELAVGGRRRLRARTTAIRMPTPWCAPPPPTTLSATADKEHEMCRWIAWLGQPVLIDELLSKTRHQNR